MASTAPNNNPYAYQKPSTLATRTLVTGEKPAETKKPVDNYSEAVKAAGQAQPKNEASGKAQMIQPPCEPFSLIPFRRSPHGRHR